MKILGKNRKFIFLPLLCILTLSLGWYSVVPVFAGEFTETDTGSSVTAPPADDPSDPPSIDQDDPPAGDPGDPPSIDQDDPPAGDPGDPPSIDQDDPPADDPDDPLSIDQGDPPTGDPSDLPSIDQGTLPDLSGDSDSSVENYTVVLDSMTIGEGECIEYTTISSEFAGNQLPEGMYPGNLTVQISGQIVVENGGFLSIGTLSIGSDSEASPVISGTLSKKGLIVVKAGGTLNLTSTLFDMDGEGFLIVQEPGASVTLTAVQNGENLISWSPPLVNNEYDTPDDVYLEEGTLLTKEHLPASMRCNVQYMGSEDRTDISLVWDMSGYSNETSGEVTLLGSFVNESGQPLLSFRPLTLTVHWYTPGKIVVTDTSWHGNDACTAELTVPEFPEDAWEICGEVSYDEGKTWIEWDSDVFDIVQDTDGNYVCIFEVPDDTPRWYRITAEDSWAPEFWVSDAFLLPTDDSDDQSGNRGGSTSPVTPEREPEPVPDKFPDSVTEPYTPPDGTDTAISESSPGSLESSDETNKPGNSTVTQPDERNPLPATEETADLPAIGYFSSVPSETLSRAAVAGSSSSENGAANTSETIRADVSLSSTGTATDETGNDTSAPRTLSRSAQILAAAVGFVFCGLIAAATAGVFHFRRKR